MTAGFPLRRQNLLRYFAPEMMHFQAYESIFDKQIKPISYRSEF